MSQTKKAAPSGTAASEKQLKDKDNEYFLLFDCFSGEMEALPLNEKINAPFGCYTSHFSGSLADMEKIKRQTIAGALNQLLNKKIKS